MSVPDVIMANEAIEQIEKSRPLQKRRPSSIKSIEERPRIDLKEFREQDQYMAVASSPSTAEDTETQLDIDAIIK